jgi:hypothetical protein
MANQPVHSWFLLLECLPVRLQLLLAVGHHLRHTVVPKRTLRLVSECARASVRAVLQALRGLLRFRLLPLI